MEHITSARNPVVRQMRELKDRKAREARDQILVEGEVMIREALGCGLQPFAVLAEEKYGALAEALEARGARAYAVPRSLLESVCETRTPQGVCACFAAPEPARLEALPDAVVALDGVQDPGNVGTIWRTADAAGFGALMLGAGSADPLSPKVLRAAMGSGFRLPFLRAEPLEAALDALKARGYAVIASALDGDDFYQRSDPGGKIVLVVGNEARGIRPETLARTTMRLKLPMRGGAESLNAAVAAGIFMYGLMNERGRK